MNWAQKRAAAMILCLSGPASSAAPPPNPDPSLRSWYQGLIDPQTTLSCCDESDCRVVEHRTVGDHFEALVESRWMSVPPEKVIHQSINPTGQAVLCYSRVLGITCFVPGPGV